MLQNEISPDGVDDQRLRADGLVVSELMGGCVCCRLANEFIITGFEKITQSWEAQGLLDLNHDNTYHSTGGNGGLAEAPGGKTGTEKALCRKMCASAESQELAGVSPEMHAEFALRYEKRLLEPFALNGYACCDCLDRKLDDVMGIPNVTAGFPFPLQ